MKRAIQLASLAIMAFSDAAEALIEGPPRPIIVAGCPSGVASFFFAGNIGGPAGVCSYYMDWQGPFTPAGSVACYVNEQKALGQTSCLGNRTFEAVSAVMSAPDCQGFDRFGIPGDVKLILGEGPGAPALNGIALFATSPFLPQSISIL